MAIQNDQELQDAIIAVDGLIQEIQDYAGRDFSKTARIRFPRGYLRTAVEARRRLEFLPESHLKKNISYTMMLSDVQQWLLVRTDLSGMAKAMIIKLQIFLLGSIVESITKTHLHGRCGGNYKRRTEFMEQHEIIDNNLRTELDWLWDVRNRMHLFQLENSEWDSDDYTVANHNRAVKAFRMLLDSINAT